MNELKTSILLYGRDKLLLKTRGWVLEGGGYRTLTAFDRAEILEIPHQPPVTLLILCHSLASRDRVEAADQASRRWPQIKTLVLTKHFLEAPLNSAGVPNVNLDSPTALIETVRELVGDPAARVSSYVH